MFLTPANSPTIIGKKDNVKKLQKRDEDNIWYFRRLLQVISLDQTSEAERKTNEIRGKMKSDLHNKDI